MKVIKIHKCGDIKISVLHSNVIKTGYQIQRLDKPTMGNNVYKCLDCGEEWVESINSPIIVEDKNVLNKKNSWTTNMIDCIKFNNKRL
jgi:hypothetical protein